MNYLDAWDWDDIYTKSEMNYIIDALFEFVDGIMVDNYNSGTIDKDELIEAFVSMGFKKDHITQLYGWIEE